jgi:predicted O-methyltransferase YrrM
MSIKTADIRCHALLNEIYCEPKVGVEIGVHNGQLSWRLLASNRNIFLYMVDPWSTTNVNESYLKTADAKAALTDAEHEKAMNEAIESVKPFGGRYEILRMKSEEAAERFADSTLDFVFIDGDHSYEGCSLDILLWFPKVRRGGLLCGHDYRDDMGFGVIRAVDEFSAKTGLEVRLGGNKTWFITR